MDLNIKDAFQRAKQDINFLKDNILDLHKELNEIQTSLLLIMKELGELKEIRQTDRQTDTSTHNSTDKLYNTTDKYSNTTDNTLKNPITTDILPFKPLKQLNMVSSIGNNGVSTDRQTDRQTDQHTQNKPEIGKNTLDNAVEILSSLDDLKKEVRLKFKRLTEQEILVFSTIYQFDEEVGYSDYKSLSQRLNLTESSIRDYVGRLIKKGIPIEKNKINNKQIQLNISANLKKIATLNTILQLRDL